MNTFDIESPMKWTNGTWRCLSQYDTIPRLFINSEICSSN